jgi:4-hydroxy-3-methylbut-2-en-1-yl diphosphate synthase IspG/GcpE
MGVDSFLSRQQAAGHTAGSSGMGSQSTRCKCACCISALLQVKKCADAGADIVRITVQGRKEAEACMKIREQLFKDR